MEKKAVVNKGMYLVGLGIAMFCCGAIFGSFLTEYKSKVCHQVDVYVISDDEETSPASASPLEEIDPQTASTESIVNNMNYDTEYYDENTVGDNVIVNSTSDLPLPDTQTESATNTIGDPYYDVDEYSESVETPRTDIRADYHFDDRNVVTVSEQENERQYFISSPNDKLNWFAALQACATKKLELVGIETNEENLKIVNAIKLTIASEPNTVGKVDDFWTSGINLWGPETKEFYWANSGLKIQNWTNWHVGMPNHPEGQHCIEITKDIDSSTSGEYMWNDYGCHISARYICEKPIISNP